MFMRVTSKVHLTNCNSVSKIWPQLPNRSRIIRASWGVVQESFPKSRKCFPHNYQQCERTIKTQAYRAPAQGNQNLLIIPLIEFKSEPTLLKYQSNNIKLINLNRLRRETTYSWRKQRKTKVVKRRPQAQMVWARLGSSAHSAGNLSSLCTRVWKRAIHFILVFPLSRYWLV